MTYFKEDKHMSKASILRQLRETYVCFYDENGNKYDTPRGIVVKRKLPDRNISILEMLYASIFSNTKISEDTKEYIKKQFITAEAVNDILNTRRDMYGEPHISLSTTRSRLLKDKNLIEALYGKYIIRDLVYSEKCDLDKYEECIINQMSGKENKEFKENCLLDIPSNIIKKRCEPEEFEDMLEFLKVYNKKAAKDTVNLIGESAIGYLNYLMTYPFLSDSDIMNKRRIEETLGIEIEFDVE